MTVDCIKGISNEKDDTIASVRFPSDTCLFVVFESFVVEFFSWGYERDCPDSEEREREREREIIRFLLRNEKKLTYVLENEF